jgi:hypothetical protein
VALLNMATMVNPHKLVIMLELAVVQVVNQPTLVLLMAVQVQAPILAVQFLVLQEFQDKVTLGG